jgi:thioesterase domain-containing protein/acyl carrier protein
MVVELLRGAVTVSNIHVRSIVREDLGLDMPYDAPYGETEEFVARTFADILGIDRVGANDAFFDLGGDSLSAESLCLSISKRTGKDLRVSNLVYYSTPRKVAEFIGRSEEARQIAARIGIDTKRPPVFLVHGLLGLTVLKPTFLNGLAPGQKVHLFELPGLRKDRSPYNSIEEIAAAYVAELCACYARGPVLLSAFCRGALIALEMSAQLHARGRSVQQLVLFDPSMPTNTVTAFGRSIGTTDVIGLTRRGPLKWLEKQFRRTLYFLLLWRWTDGANVEDYADARLRRIREQSLKVRFWWDRLVGKDRVHAKITDSLSARAKLHTAYRHYWPRRYDGPASIIASADRQRSFEDQSLVEARLWSSILPQAKVHVVGRTHEEVLGANSSEPARIMQSIFDANVETGHMNLPQRRESDEAIAPAAAWGGSRA